MSWRQITTPCRRTVRQGKQAGNVPWNNQPAHKVTGENNPKNGRKLEK